MKRSLRWQAWFLQKKEKIHDIPRKGRAKKEIPVNRKDPGRNSERTYERHKWSGKEIFLQAVKCSMVSGGFAWLFYRSIPAFFPVCVIAGTLLTKKDSRKKALEDQRKLTLQFGDCLQAVKTSMEAGYSIENAFLESVRDMNLLHGSRSFIVEELVLLKRGLQMNRSLEILLADLGKRSAVPSIREFAEVFGLAKRNGGNVEAVIQAFLGMVQNKVRIQEELMVQSAGKKLEQKVMNLMPFLIAGYLEAINKGFFDSLYYNPRGIGIMSGCMAAYVGAYLLGERILEQEMKMWRN